MEGDFSYIQLMANIEANNGIPFPRSDEGFWDWKTAFVQGVAREDNERNPSFGESSGHEQNDSAPAEDNSSDPGISSDEGEDGVCNSNETDDDLLKGNGSDYGGSEEESEEDMEENFIFPVAETFSDDDDDDVDQTGHQGQEDQSVHEYEVCEEVPTEETNTDSNTEEQHQTFRRRKRYPKGVELPSSRECKTMGPVEVAMRASADRKTKQIFLPVVGTVFDSLEQAYEFYNLYSWEKGFGISFGKSDSNRLNKYKTMQELQCSCEGWDRRTHHSIRCGCRAIIRLLRTDDHGWYISKFVEDHNHAYSQTCGEKMQWGSHRRIDEYAKKMIKYLRDNNVPLGKVHSIMGSMYGSVRDLPFTKRCLRTLCQQLAREQMDNDVKKTLAIFRKMRSEDPDFAYSVDVDKHNRIKTLIWTNHRSKVQYQCFGDVFTFDTTYCTNIYKMPFGLFVGVNNHFQSVIYAGVLMRQERIKSFVWVFNEFLSLMGGKAPVTILTDQCQAMMSALKISMPETTHLWCKWHVLRKAQESLGPVYSKKTAFRQEFHKVLNEMLTEQEFENAWENLISTYNLRENPFMVRTYECRRMWAKPYSKGQFCARMMSTQRGESANHMLKKYVRSNSTMNNFVEKYNDMIFDRAMEEDSEEHKTNMLKMSSKNMWPLQHHASKIYTRASFKLFTTELEKSYHFVVVHGNDDNLYNVNHCYSELREPWVRVSFEVTANKDGGKYECECGLFTHFGILCCHAIRVMNYLGVPTIPDRYILKRWTRDARDVLPDNMRFLQKDSRSLKSHTFRDNLLYGTAMKAVKAANKNFETFSEMMKHFGAGIKSVDDIMAARGDRKVQEDDHHYESSDNEWHRVLPVQYQSEPELGYKGKQKNSNGRLGSWRKHIDLATLKEPLIVKSTSGRKRAKRFLSPVEQSFKGRKRKTKQVSVESGNSFKQTKFCGFCKLSGHKRNTCPVNPEAGKNRRKTPCCSICKLPGHKRSQCYTMKPSDQDFDFSDI